MRALAERYWRGLVLPAIPAAALMLALLTGAAQSAQDKQAGEILVRAPQAVLMDAESGAIMFQRNGDELMHPGSMSKLMVLAVVFKALQAGEVKLTDEFFMSEYAWRRGGAPSGNPAMFVPVGTRATLEDLIKGITVQSGNDAAISIAENMGGNEGLFAQRMTEEARRIGLKKAVFKNATGFFHAEHQMTAREVAMLARHIIKTYPEQYAFFGLREFQYRKHKFTNRNPLVGLVDGVDGLQASFAKQVGHSLVASAKQDNRRLIVVVNGLATAEERRDDARRLLDGGFRNFAAAKLFDAGEVVGHARVWGGARMYVPLVGEGDVNIWLPRNAVGPKLKAHIVYKWPLKSPVKKGDQVALLRVTAANEAMNEVPLFAAEDVEQAGTMRRGFDSILWLATRWLP
jgi:serine-type D-Ala-D-Ala carboxypeptidase (penicillin-binding protein 5/6)